MAKKIYTAEENAQLLSSWNAWKDLCWIHGLGKRLGDGPVVGTSEDEVRLVALVKSAFLRKLEPYKTLLCDAGGCDALSDLDCAQEFDGALHEYESAVLYDQHHWGEKDHVRKAKAWKNFVWQAVAQSDDPPLKVILGMLLGKLGVINRVVEEWILKNYSGHFEIDPETGTKILVLDDSRDRENYSGKEDGGSQTEEQKEQVEQQQEAVRQSDNQERENGNWDASPDDDREEGAEEDRDVEASDSKVEGLPLQWVAELGKAFSPRLCCILCAHYNDVKLYDEPEILAALGVGKSTANTELSRRAAEAFAGLPVELRESIAADDAVLRAFKKWIESKVELEKAGRLILSRVAARENGKA